MGTLLQMAKLWVGNEWFPCVAFLTLTCGNGNVDLCLQDFEQPGVYLYLLLSLTDALVS